MSVCVGGGGGGGGVGGGRGARNSAYLKAILRLLRCVSESIYQYRKNSKIWDTSNNCHKCPKNRNV